MLSGPLSSIKEGGLLSESINTADFKKSINHHMKYSLGNHGANISIVDWRVALSLTIRDLVVDPWMASAKRVQDQANKRVYYLSMEFLIGRLLEDSIVNLGLDDIAREAIEASGINYDEVLKDEPDAALGNGGLGRLAACFIESMSTLGCPAFGFGIRYEHGLFKQSFKDGAQMEDAETWLKDGNVWEFEQAGDCFQIGFGGSVKKSGGKHVWTPDNSVIATPYDTPVIGWQGKWANTLRLWSAKPVQIFDLDKFNVGDFAGAAEAEMLARTISRVLYPDDTTDQGKELRLKQEYFFTAASVRDVIRRHISEGGSLQQMADRVSIQLNDTHPAIAGPELVRILHDEHGFNFEQAVETARSCLSYTNHTLLPEALERWPQELMARVLPRHMQLIEQIDKLHKKQNPKRAKSVAVLENGEVKMGELAFINAHRVNGVSALHTDLMKLTVFSDLHKIHPDRIVNETNGVTPRRWLWSCNRPLSNLITDSIGDGWVDQLERLDELTPFLDDAGFIEKFAAAKHQNKSILANWIKSTCNLDVDPNAMFDVQIKRIHEYKRQLLNILEAIAYWNEIRNNPDANWTPRVKIFGGKAAPGYVVAKEIIHLINDVAKVINADPLMKGRLIILYPPNYNVTMAEKLIPATDLSEQISTAGKEASGTGNMKIALNGAPTIGTLDGANVEIRECVGDDNFFLFGLDAHEVEERRANKNHSREAIEKSPRLSQALKQISDGVFSADDKSRYGGIVSMMHDNDYFLVCADFDSYYKMQREVDVAFNDKSAWTRMAATNTAKCGWFSSDRTIRGYMNDVWKMESAL